MSAERIPANMPSLDFEALHNEIELQLYLYPTPASADISKLLQESYAAPDLDACLARTKAILLSSVEDEAVTLKSQARAFIQREYPLESENAETIESPGQFCKKNDLSGDARPRLREAFSRTTNESKQRLAEIIGVDQQHKQFNLPVSDKELSDVILTANSAFADQVRQAANALQELMPPRRIAYDSFEVFILRSAGFRGFQTVDPPKSDLHRNQIEMATAELRRSLMQLKQAEELLPVAVSDQYETSILQVARKQLQAAYYEKILQEQQLLASNLQVAYAEVSPRMAREAAADRSNRNTDQHAPESLEEVVDLIVPREQQVQETMKLLGTIDSPFPWSPEAQIAISQLRQNGSSLLFCEALSPASAAVSQEIRREKRTSDNVDRLWDMVRQIELTNTSGTHEWINKVDSILNEDYKDVLVLGYGNLGPNARRIYYVKTTTERYDEINNLAAANGLPTPQPLLVLIAETDKAHQLKTYAGFGIKRVHARKRNVGSV